MTKFQHRAAWFFLTIVLTAVIFADFQAVTTKESPPLLERTNCQQIPHRTVPFDRSKKSDMLYQGIFNVFFKYGVFLPVCTVGYDGKQVVVRIGDQFFITDVDKPLGLHEYHP